MKGVILSFPAKGRVKATRKNFKSQLPLVVFTLFFTVGVVFGAVTSLKSTEEFLLDMDFLFTTNLQSRLNFGALSSFGAHFASNFIFFSLAFLCGLSPWGVGVLPFIVAFKGFGTGLSGAYLMSTYGLKGLGFYLAVELPGAFVFSLALLFMCCECSKMSLSFARVMLLKSENTLNLKKYFFRCTYYLLLSAVGALCDMFFWSFVSGLFF